MPVLGGVAASIGILLTGESELRRLFWLPLLLDVGCIPMIAYAVIKAMRHQGKNH